MTPHIEAQPDDFAPTCLLPGDPLRAEHIANTFLSDVVKINTVRNMLGFTGYFQGTPVSVMGSGMGIPSISIYAKELITEYGVNNLIRVGSCGAVSDKVKVRDIIIGMGAFAGDRLVVGTGGGGIYWIDVSNPEAIADGVE